jgi:16S rRNA (cytosine1402-N4)-methyltransferase
METTTHKSVLLREVVAGLNLKEGARYLDGTINAGGHAKALWEASQKTLSIVGFDQDGEALKRAETTLKEVKDLTLILSNFRHIEAELLKRNIQSGFDGVLLDLGLSSDQLDTSGRGFSFRFDEPLLMTMMTEKPLFTAHDIVNSWEEESLIAIIKNYGEEGFAKRIAQKIVAARESGEIKTSKQLAEIIKYAVPLPVRYKKIHPATKTFQALRIAVNDELQALKEGLAGAFKVLAPNGRLAVISFHSLEDRIVKQWMREMADQKVALLVTKKPIVPTDKEIQENPRSRSAKLRILEKF